MNTAQKSTFDRMNVYFQNAPKEELAKYGKQIADFYQNNPNDFSAACLTAARAAYKNRFSGKEVVSMGDAAAVTVSQKLAEVDGLTFTVEFADGSYSTIRIQTLAKGKLEGKTIVEFLSGPDNERDFQGCGFIGSYGTAKPWKKFENTTRAIMACQAANVVMCGDSNQPYTEAYAMLSGRCARCGHKLTVPASLHRGLGPECAKKGGV